MFISRQQSVELLPAMHHGCGIDFRNPEQDSIPQLLPRLHANVPQEGSRHFAEKRLDNVQPGAVGGRQHVFEAIGTSAQDPAAGSRVRREWPVRITESLGAQRVEIPELTGQTERSATIGIRRLSLELGAVAHLAIAGDPDVVLTQTPPANASGVDGPRVSLLVSDAAIAQPNAYAMPSLVGLSYSAANARAASAGLHLVAVPESALPTAAPAASAANPAPNGLTTPAPSVAAPAAPSATRPAAVRPSGIVTAQSPQAGRRVVQGDVVHVTLGHSAPPAAAPVATQ